MGSIWLCLEHNEKQSTTQQYFTDVDRLKLTMVSNVDKEEIVNYFTGKTEFTEAINQELRSQFSRVYKGISYKTKPNIEKT